nr:ribonuclease H-like domain-containing protein [Tanacetum cinerariifolium]
MCNLHPKRNFVPRTVLMRSGLKTHNTARQNSSRIVVSVNTARQINTAYPRPTVYSARPVSNGINRAHSHDKRPINNKTSSKNNKINQKVNTARAKHVNTAMSKVNTPRPKAILNVVQENQAIHNLSCKRKELLIVDHMTGKMSYLSEYKEIDGGYVAFGEDPKGGKITRKGKISTDTECVVLSLDFKLLDESQVLLRVLRKNNMYSVDLKNVATSGGLTCLLAKATLDESNLWHRRLGHINFKTMNKLVRGNLVREYPTKNSSSAFPSNLPRGSKVSLIITGHPNDLIKLKLGVLPWKSS